MIGRVFSRLTVISQAETQNQKRRWNCRCICGKIITIPTGALSTGNTKSCGCLRIARAVERLPAMTKAATLAQTTHGGTGTRLFRIWKGMRSRCNRATHPDYDNYGGRGISVCKSWNEDFSVFREWANANGYAETLTIDRIDFNGNYEPENCRWITQADQCRNTRRIIFVELNGERLPLSTAAIRVGIQPETVRLRYHAGVRGAALFRRGK